MASPGVFLACKERLNDAYARRYARSWLGRDMTDNGSGCLSSASEGGPQPTSVAGVCMRVQAKGWQPWQTVLQSLGPSLLACLLLPRRLAAQMVAHSQQEWKTQPCPGCCRHTRCTQAGLLHKLWRRVRDTSNQNHSWTVPCWRASCTRPSGLNRQLHKAKDVGRPNLDQTARC